MNAEKLKKIVRLHGMWIYNQDGGERADFENVDLGEIDLSTMVLDKANLQNASLMRANLAGCSLVGAYMHGINLSLANLEESNLSGAHMEKATLQGANFTKANLNEANLKGCQLAGTNFFQTSLKRACLESTSCVQTSFYMADMEGSVFSSKSALGQLAGHFDQEQLQQVIFLDEVATDDEKVSPESKHRMVVTISGAVISPYNVSLLLATINAAYNNMFFLINYNEETREVEFSQDKEADTAEELELKSIKQYISPFYQGVGASNDIFVTSIRNGSQIYEIATALAENYPILKYVAGILALSSSSYTWFSVEKKRYNETKKVQAETKKIEAEVKSITFENEQKILAIFNEEKENSEQLTRHINTIKEHPGLEKYLATIPVKSETVKNNMSELSVHACQPLMVVNKKMSAYNYQISISFSDEQESKELDKEESI
jgi:uncharacterized protein YjbI with pentapeptide repeats